MKCDNCDRLAHKVVTLLPTSFAFGGATKTHYCEMCDPEGDYQSKMRYLLYLKNNPLEIITPAHR